MPTAYAFLLLLCVIYKHLQLKIPDLLYPKYRFFILSTVLYNYRAQHYFSSEKIIFLSRVRVFSNLNEGCKDYGSVFILIKAIIAKFVIAFFLAEFIMKTQISQGIIVSYPSFVKMSSSSNKITLQFFSVT